MSRENIEIVRRGYEAFNRGDYDGMVVDFAPDFEFVPTGVLPDAERAYYGPDGWKRFTRWLSDHFDAAHIEAQEILDGDDSVLASVILSGQGKESGAETRWRLWHVWTLRGGKVVRGRAFATRAQALEAVGLSE